MLRRSKSTHQVTHGRPWDHQVRQYSTYSAASSSKKTLNNRWELGRRLGAGVFGIVMLGTDLSSMTTVAIKTARQDSGLELRNEYSVLRQIHRPYNVTGIPRPVYLGSNADYTYMVMNRLGDNLLDKGKELQIVSIHTLYQLAIMLIDCLEKVHEAGFIHRDIKLDNLMMGRQDPERLYLVDFGLARRWRDPQTRKHYSRRSAQSPRPPSIFWSTNMHYGYETTRRDDMIMAGFTLVNFFKGTLPWMGVRARDSDREKHKILKVKEKTTNSQLCEGMGTPMIKYFRHVCRLGYKKQPDYEYLRDLFREGLKRRGLEEDGVFDWTESRLRRTVSSPAVLRRRTGR